MGRVLGSNKLVIQVFLFMFFLWSTSCSNYSKNSSLSVTIKGKIDPNFSRTKTIYLYQFTDSLGLFFGEKRVVDSCNIKQDGAFEFTILPSQSGAFFDLGTSEFVFARNYYVEAGESIQLNFEGNTMPLTLTSYAEAGRYNQFMQIFADTFYREPNIKKEYFNTSNFLLAPAYATYINQRKDKQIEFYQNYFRGQKLDSNFAYFFEKETLFNWANDKIYFLWKKRTRQEFVPLDTSYFDFLQLVNSDDARALICPGYSRYVTLLLSELYQEDVFNYPMGYSQALYKAQRAKDFFKGTGLKMAYHRILKDELQSINSNVNENQTEQIALVDSIISIAYLATSDSSFYTYSIKK
ncbi:MAG: hypothetical protein K9H61_09255 [Bacteroidia bacterium]|nr:hypothetical protein [Bacteroidia bacterium]MCF8425832.1 hypothetical protein [Bacteroidia bacterium]MCF8447168.1 hypothetical protein [Bacteroidia bacterium]